ncbi:MAG: tetratricopeptide repeat protein [Phycisphaerales bacterium]
MAARVNVRFVAILCTIVGVVFVGMAGAAYFIVKKSASDHYEAAQQFMQAGDFVEAEKSYGKAVNKEPTNVVYLESWIESIEKLTPETQTKYADVYWKNYVPGLRQLAVAQRTNVDAWDKFLGTQYEQRNVFGAGGRSNWQSLLSETNFALEQFLATEQANDEQADWHRLRRYRALSNLNMRLGSGEADPDFKDKTVLDFEAALRVDPDDDEAAVGLYEWLMAEANENRMGRTDPQVYLDRAKETLDDFLAENPNHPRVLIARLYYDLQVAARPLRDLRTQEERVRANLALASEFKPRVEVIVDQVIRQSPPEMLTVEVAQLVHRLERLTSPGSSEIPLTNRILEAATQAAQDDPGTLAQIAFFEGVFAAESNDHERAISAFERVLESPDVPVSLEGIILTLLNGQAVLRQAQSAIELANAAEGDQVQAARDRVTEYREKVERYWTQGTPSVLLLDARIAYMRGELASAQGLAVSYQRESNGTDPQAHFLLSRIYMDRNQVGQAIEELKKFVELSPNVPEAWAQLSDLQDRVGDTDGAWESIVRAVQLAPDDPRIQRRYENFRIRTGQVQSDDPIQQALLGVDRMLDTTGGVSPRYEQAEQLIRGLMGQTDDARLYNALATIQGMQRKTDEALATIDEGLSKYPDNRLLQQLATQIRFMSGELPDDLEPIRAEMLQYRMAMRDGRTEDAQRHLEAAIKIDPDDAEVIQTQILRAIANEQWSEAERLIVRATELNADQAGGRVLRANLLQARGRSEEALGLINAVISDGLTSVPVLYRRAQIYRSLGRTEDAVADYQEILRRQPDSVTNVRDVIVALAELGRTKLALDIARRSQRIAGADETFLNQWLALEAQVGDSTAAMYRREEIREQDPGNRQNNLALASVYVKLGQWNKARQIIDELRAEQDDVALVMLDARWHAEQGDTRQAVDKFDQYMAARDRTGDLDARDVLSYANFLQSQNRSDLAIQKLRNALDQDTDESQPIRRRLALLLLAAGRSDEAVEVIDQLIASGQDTDGMLKLARVEAYIRGDMPDRAQQALDGLDSTLANSEAAGILRADLALARGDSDAARQAISNTLATHPTSARAYVRRAEIIYNEVRTDDSIPQAERNQLLRDAGEDVSEAIRQDPGRWEAYRLRALIAMEQGRYDDAARAVASALEINPGLSQLRNQLIRRLVQNGDTPRAMTVVDAALQANPADVDLRVNMARLMADLGRTGESIRLFEQSLAQRRNPEIAAQFVEFLLNLNTGEARAKARQVLSDTNLDVAGTWQLRLMSAGLSMQEGNRPRAIAEAIASFEMVRNDTAGVIRWFNAMPALIKDHPTRMEIAVQLAPERTPDRVGEIMMASLMLQDPSTEQQGLSELARLAGDREAIVAVRSGQLLGDKLYERGDYQRAAEAWRAVIALNPQSGQSLNNLAYVLATEMGQCEQAIKLANRAKEAGGIAPAIVQSTLSVAYMECDRLAEAQQAADELSTIARGSPEEALAEIRQGQIDLANGRIDAARTHASDASDLLEAWGGRAEAYRSILEELQQELDGR